MRHLSSPDLSTRGTYPVLAPLSRGYPGLEGRLPTCYSPVRHWDHDMIAHAMIPVRLACVKYAASVRSEPGSNSPSKSELVNLVLEAQTINCARQSLGRAQGSNRTDGAHTSFGELVAYATFKEPTVSLIEATGESYSQYSRRPLTIGEALLYPRAVSVSSLE